MAHQPLRRYLPLIGPERFEALVDLGTRTVAQLDGARVWNVNSTANGGGVAEMLRTLLGYSRSAGLDARWLVIQGDAEFFDLTKRLHNHLHGYPGAGPLDQAAVGHYSELTRRRGETLAAGIGPGEVVILHDPQTAGMIGPLVEAGAHVVWRCHIGTEQTNRWTDAAWALLQPHVEQAETVVFSRAAYAPPFLPPSRLLVIPPSIDPFAVKNQDLSATEVSGILHAAGLGPAGPGVPGRYRRADGRWATVRRPARIEAGAGGLEPGSRLVVQVSRWDRLKDMAGVMEGFARVVGSTDAHLALVGPAVSAVSDDPEGRTILDECVSSWSALSPEARRRVRLISLPMDDVDENAAMVNALQRRSILVTQKSLAEGFGITASEAMWKARPVVASAVGGLVDQVTEETGALVKDPSDLDAFGKVLLDLLGRPDQLRSRGRAARRRVLDCFVGDRHLLELGTLVLALVGSSGPAATGRDTGPRPKDLGHGVFRP